jgi:hypothetical protein
MERKRQLTALEKIERFYDWWHNKVNGRRMSNDEHDRVVEKLLNT